MVEDKGISCGEMKEKLSEFLGKKHVYNELSEDDYARLTRLKDALQREQTEATTKEAH